MKIVLIIAYHFPPLGGPAVLRTLKFARYLPRFKYKPIVLSPDPKFINYHSFDYSLVNEIPREVETVKSFIIDVNWLYKFLHYIKMKKVGEFINRSLLFPECEKAWLFFAKRRIKEILQKRRVDIVFITSPPFSTQILGLYIKKRFQLPIISDYRDPLTFDETIKRGHFFKKCFVFEKRLLDNADFVIANTPSNRMHYIEDFNIPHNKVETITNGFDKSDFQKIEYRIRSKTKIVFSHIGQLYGDHSALPILLALNRIRENTGMVEFRFVGRITTEDRQLINRMNLHRLTRIINYCSHEEALSYAQESDYLVLIQRGANWSHSIPGKTFEYINLGKKILAVVPENGDCAEIIRKTKTGFVIAPDKTACIANAILQLIEDREESIFNPNTDEIAKYDYFCLTERLAKIFDLFC